MDDSTPPTTVSSESAQFPLRSRRSWAVPLLSGAGGFILGAIVALGVVSGVAMVSANTASAVAAKAKAARSAILSSALSSCSIENGDDAQIGDRGYTLTVNNKGDEDYSGISYSDLACLQTKLHTPQSVMSHLEQTTSLDGRQTETWGSLSESWSYHPDRGLDAVFTVKR